MGGGGGGGHINKKTGKNMFPNPLKNTMGKRPDILKNVGKFVGRNITIIWIVLALTKAQFVNAHYVKMFGRRNSVLKRKNSPC